MWNNSQFIFLLTGIISWTAVDDAMKLAEEMASLKDKARAQFQLSPDT